MDGERAEYNILLGEQYHTVDDHYRRIFSLNI